MPDQVVQENVVKMVSMFLDPILEIKELFSPIMIELIIPEACCQFPQENPNETLPSKKDSFFSLNCFNTTNDSNSLCANYYIRFFELLIMAIKIPTPQAKQLVFEHSFVEKLQAIPDKFSRHKHLWISYIKLSKE